MSTVVIPSFSEDEKTCLFIFFRTRMTLNVFARETRTLNVFPAQNEEDVGRNNSFCGELARENDLDAVRGAQCDRKS